MTALPGLGAFLGYVHPKGQLFEIRLLGSNPRTCSGLFNDPTLAYNAVCRAAKTWPSMNFYYTLNPIDPGCELVKKTKLNVIVPHPQATAKDADVLTRRLCMIDIDPQRPTGTSATAHERSLAKELTKSVRSYLSDEGWPLPTLVSSGNGYQLLYRVAPCPSASTSMRSALAVLAKRFDTESVHIDRCVHNAARIARLPWTVNRKGSDTFERPHRRSKVLRLGGATEMNDCQIGLLAERLREEIYGVQNPRHRSHELSSRMASPHIVASGCPLCLLSEDDVHRLLELYSDVLPLQGVYRDGGRVRFQLAVCPVKGAPHRDQTAGTGKTAIIWAPGVLGFKCFSDDCCDVTIGSVLSKLVAQTGRRFAHPIWKTGASRVESQGISSAYAA